MWEYPSRDKHSERVTYCVLCTASTYTCTRWPTGTGASLPIDTLYYSVASTHSKSLAASLWSFFFRWAPAPTQKWLSGRHTDGWRSETCREIPDNESTRDPSARGALRLQKDLLGAGALQKELRRPHTLRFDFLAWGWGAPSSALSTRWWIPVRDQDQERIAAHCPAVRLASVQDEMGDPQGAIRAKEQHSCCSTPDPPGHLGSC